VIYPKQKMNLRLSSQESEKKDTWWR